MSVGAWHALLSNVNRSGVQSKLGPGVGSVGGVRGSTPLCRQASTSLPAAESQLSVAARGNGSAGAGENHGYVVRLFSSADPFRHGVGNGLTDARKRLFAVLLNQRNQALLAEFAGVVLRFCDAIAEAVQKHRGDPAMISSDRWACRTMRPWLEKRGVKFAPWQVAMRFSAENVIYSGQFGYHGRLTAEMNGWGGKWLGAIR